MINLFDALFFSVAKHPVIAIAITFLTLLSVSVNTIGALS